MPGATTVASSHARTPPRAPSRPAVTGHPAIVIFSALWMVAADNFPFWRTVWLDAGGLRMDNAGFLALLPLTVIAWTCLQVSLLAWGRATKPVIIILLLVAAATGYFTSTYGMLLDYEMIENVVQTHGAEAMDLLTWRFAGWMLVAGVLPALLVARRPFSPGPWRRELGGRLAVMATAIACLAMVLLAHYPHFASLLRNHRELRLMLAPHNSLAAAYGYTRQKISMPTVLQKVGEDATHDPSAPTSAKPTLTVIVVGETARAANFSLNGYARETNPALARQGAISFSDVSACGTSTAVSVPCMFLDVGRGGYRNGLAKSREGLLDVLQRAGIEVSWLDNNSGCKDVCDRVPHPGLANHRTPALCGDGECLDEILLGGLRADLDRPATDRVVVLHMHGSHGPAYYKRYPPAFEAFTPACRTSQLDQCTRESIVNAYDNSLRYTDYVLSRAIDLLRDHAGRFDAALLYVSDHGESLGENGLYLHGIPYALAPREQTRVPMVLWLSEGMREREGIDLDCLRARRQESLSHDHLFHSVVGLSNVRTSVYRPALDLFRPCRA